jgi:predicted nucleic acid-binding protein
LFAKAHMADVLLDSDVVIWHLRGRKPVVERVLALARDERIGLSAITRAEVLLGMREPERKATFDFLNACKTLAVDAAVAEQGAEIIRTFRANGITISLPDALIGATALGNKIPLYTCNTRHYPMPGLDLRRVVP